ncbi:MAG TPA: winged helix-turn-helix domain-containing protein [Rhodanobacteraceae bacterium]|nr:winged helix-turn-helix domain-containing protein [Rhodanobacteraceae bacterium]
MNHLEYRFGDHRLFSATRQIWRRQQPVHAPRSVFDCILYLIENRDRAIGRDELVAAVWGRVDVADTQLSQLMRRVRRTLGDDGQSQRTVATVQGFGYRWAIATDVEPAVEDRADKAPAAESPQAASTPAGTATGRTGTRWKFSAAASVLVLLGGVAVAMLWHVTKPMDTVAPPSASMASRFVVLPLAVEGPADAAWIRLGAMDVVASRLRGTGLIVPPSESVLATLQGSAPDALVKDASARYASSTIVGGLGKLGDSGWTISLWARSGDSVRRTGSATDKNPIEAASLAADALAAALGRSPARSDAGSEAGTRIARVRAALLANEVATARALLRVDGKQKETPELRYWRAQTDFRAGDFDAALSAFDALAADPATESDTTLHGRICIARAGVRIRQAEYALAEKDFDDAANVLRALPESPEYAEALAGRGIARVALGRFDEAASDLGRARLQMERAGDAFGATRVDANLGLFELTRHRPAAALPYLDDAARRFESFGAISAVLSTLNAKFDALALLLRWKDARAVSERRWALRARAVDPMQRYLIDVDRSRVLTAMGRYREAAELLDAADAEFPDMRPQIRQVLMSQRAELAWREGRMAAAFDLARKALAESPCTDTEPPCGRLLLTYQRALIASGDVHSDGPAPGPAELSGNGETAARPVIALAEAEWAVHQQRPERAAQQFARALEIADRDGVPSEVAEVAISYARWLIGQGRLDEASALAGRTAAWAGSDFDCALLQVAILHAWGRAEPWREALDRARALAGEREVPADLARPPG